MNDKEKIDFVKIAKQYSKAGEKHITNEGYKVEIIEYFGWDNCSIQFEDGTVVKNRTYQNIVKGEICNPYHKSVCGVGYFGVGKYNSKINYKAYKTWDSMIKRCYSEKEQEKCPTYIGCFVNERWHNFQNFGEWFYENHIEGFELDKDILVKGNKIYSPETCCFVPHEINSLFIKSNSIRGKYAIGVHKVKSAFIAQLNIRGKRVYLGRFNTHEEAFHAYKTAKEACIKEVADKWKDKIDPRVYQAMCNYRVEIHD